MKPRSEHNSEPLLARAFADARPSGNGWLRTNCPFCNVRRGKEDHRHSLRFRRDNFWFDCFACKVRGFLRKSAVHELPPESLESEDKTPANLAPPMILNYSQRRAARSRFPRKNTYFVDECRSLRGPLRNSAPSLVASITDAS